MTDPATGRTVALRGALLRRRKEWRMRDRKRSFGVIVAMLVVGGTASCGGSQVDLESIDGRSIEQWHRWAGADVRIGRRFGPGTGLEDFAERVASGRFASAARIDG